MTTHESRRLYRWSMCLAVILATLATTAEAATTIVPKQFLRRWDPITLFFSSDRGPETGGPADQPEQLFTITPLHPGAATWIDARTLIFRPTVPWPALQQLVLEVDGRRHPIRTLLDAPIATVPGDGETGLEPVETIALTFADPVDAATLAQMTRIELRPLPGLSAAPGDRWLDHDDFDIKRLPGAAASYLVALNRPIELGMRAIVHLRLGLDDVVTAGDRPTLSTYAFATAEPFRVSAIGCATSRYPIAPGGSRFAAEQALRCDPDPAFIRVELTSPPVGVDPVIGRNLIRFEPAVDDLSYTTDDHAIEIRGSFVSGVLYQLSTADAALRDRHGQLLRVDGVSKLFVYFETRPDYLRFTRGNGVCERRGPKRVPVEGRGDARVDLRIHRIDPFDVQLWPFPESSITIDESERPPGPGEEPTSSSFTPARIATLGSPLVSTVVDLPLTRGGRAATFGLNLEPFIDDAPGTYLVGIRRLDGSSMRSWMRVQVTDLAITTLEEPSRVRFVVTSLRSGTAVSGALVRVEARKSRHWTTLVEGTTGGDGSFTWSLDPAQDRARLWVARLVVERDGDLLVLDPGDPTDRFHDGHWFDDHERWLAWTQEDLEHRAPQQERVAHLFTERPMYRPEDPVHIAGFARIRDRGSLTPLTSAATLRVFGPGDREWNLPVDLGDKGRFYHKFDDADQPSGHYEVYLNTRDGDSIEGMVAFDKEPYKIPKFELRLHAPDRVPLDRPFDIELTASYYAGGRVGDQPLSWRVTQFPHVWSHATRDGFVYSSDARFSANQEWQSTPRLERSESTDGDGAARLQIDPSIEPTAQPRSYIVEATVTGADDQTVSATKKVIAVPPFVLGLRVDRFIASAQQITPSLLVADGDGTLVAGIDVTVRLKHRQWHSHLRASDFSDGVARYVTDVVDEPVLERTVTSATEPVELTLPVTKGGVYVVEIEGRDALGRAQVVAADLYVGGDQPIAWPRPHSMVFTARADQEKYRPGDDARIVLESPFQRAQALAIVEAPEGNIYSWVRVRDGAATFSTPIRGTWTPRVPIHFVLMRGRVAGSTPAPDNPTDQGKPTTLATTTWLQVDPVDNRIDVTLNAPERALPGATIDVELALDDPDGQPRAGEVALWLVDRAVLALGREAALDPVPSFITAVYSRLAIHDTRNLAFGQLPLSLLPGGGEGDLEASSLLDRVTVRRDFQPVPFFDPEVIVDASGRRTVAIKLPDDVTTFMVRAKATSGPDRFGAAGGSIAVRLPVVVQPALPRFVRRGDQFVVGAIARIVEGDGGPASAALEIEGARRVDDGEATVEFDWQRETPHRLDVPVAIDAASSADNVRFRVAVERRADRAADAFEVTIPIVADRRVETQTTLVDLAPGTPERLEAVDEPARPGSVVRTLLVSREPAVLKMAAAMEYLARYPHHCTEQRLSRARALIAFGRLMDVLHDGDEIDPTLSRVVADTSAWLESAIDDDGLVAYWPGADGYVSLTAWSLGLLVEARGAGIEVDQALFDRLARTLDRALRSDYRRFVSGQEFAERAWAMTALASAGELDASYISELTRKSQYLDAEGVAHVALALSAQGGDTLAAARLVERLWDAVVVRLHQGRDVYGGLQTPSSTSPLLLPSDTRTLAAVTRALHALDGSAARLPLLVDGLIASGRGDGWGSTNANAEAIAALAALLTDPAEASAATVEVRSGGESQTLELAADSRLAQVDLTDSGPIELRIDGDHTVAILATTRYVPLVEASQLGARATGFVVTREALRVVAEDAPLERQAIEQGTALARAVGDVVEEHVQVVNPSLRSFVAVTVPLAAGVEPLNPNLETAPPEATSRNRTTAEPTYVDRRDDRITYYFDTLDAGTYDLYFRTRAVTTGTFIQPPAEAEMMYDESVRGRSAGATMTIARGRE